MRQIDLNLTSTHINEDKEVYTTLLQVIKKYDSVLITAPQGTGKTTFLKKLKEQYNIAILSPTISLARQTKRNLNISLSNGIGFTTFNITDADRWGSPKTGNVSTTFSSSAGLTNMNLLDSIQIIVIDEIHKMIQYSTFAYSQVSYTLEIVDYALQQGIKVLFMTATPNLIPCLKQLPIKKSIEVFCKIHADRQYITKCLVLDELTNNTALINKIKQNDKKDGFQIVLLNHKDEIATIASKLNKMDIKSLAVSGQQFKEDSEIRNKVYNITRGIYEGYKVLLATSWIDCGLDFIGENISCLYCIFDNFYATGDFTIIQQFMARCRNSMPKLYIISPRLTENEKLLMNNYEFNQGELYMALEKLAKSSLSCYKKGLINQKVMENTYGIYQCAASMPYRDKFNYSSITLNYQIHKIFDKISIYRDRNEIANLLSIPQTKLYFEELSLESLYLDRITQFIENAINDDLAFSTDEICERIKELSEGRFVFHRPTSFLNRHLPQYKTKVTNRRHTRKYRFIYSPQ